MYCVGGFFLFSEFFPFHVIMQGKYPLYFLRKKSRFSQLGLCPSCPRHSGWVAVTDPTVALALDCLCHLPLDSMSLRAVGSHHLCASLSPSCAQTRASYKYAQCSPIRAGTKASPGSGDPELMSRCVEAITFKGLTVSRQVFVHNPTQQSSVQGGERMAGIERKSPLKLACREASRRWPHLALPRVRSQLAAQKGIFRHKRRLGQKLGEVEDPGRQCADIWIHHFHPGIFNWNYF